jgi:hypothetical protein
VAAVLSVGLILGAFAGWAWHRAHRTWKDWRRAVAGVGALRRLFWRHGFQGALWGLGLLLVLWLFVR